MNPARPKKIIISYVSAGGGHYRAAQALYDYFKANCRNSEVTLVDVLEKTHPLFKEVYTRGYLFLINHLLWLWKFFFWITSLECLRFASDALHFLSARLNTRGFAGFLIRQNPDFVISTHFLASEIAAYLKQSERINSRLVSVVTDFSVHPYWIYRATDIYAVASGRTKSELMKAGIEEDRIRDSGIPVKQEFLLKYDKGSLAKKLGLARDKFTVLIVTGSFGIGPIEEIVGLLYEETQILAVCAANRQLYKKLKNKNYPGVSVFGFVGNIHELMAVSDLVITKPGGLTISEALAMGAAPVFISPIPGQETGNIRVLQSYGIGLTIRRAREIKGIVMDFKENPGKLEEMKKRISQIRKPFAAREICDAVCESGIGASG